MAVNVSGNLTKLFLKKETTYGAAVSDFSGSVKLHQSSFDGAVNYDFSDENVNLGDNFFRDSFQTGKKVSGAMNFSLHPEQLGHFLFYTFSDSGQFFPPLARVIVTYTGTSESCIIKKTLNNITAKKGTLNSESNDANWGTAGVLDVSAITSLTDLVSTINGYTDYQAYILQGDTSQDPEDLHDIGFTQIKNLPLPLTVFDLSSTLTENKFIPENNQASFSLLFEKVIEKIVYSGCKISGIDLNIEPRSIINGSANLTIQDANAQSFTSTSAEEKTRPYLTNSITAYVNGVQAGDIKKISLKYSNGMQSDEKILGSRLIAEPNSTNHTLDIDIDFRYTSDTLAYKTLYDNETAVSLVLYCEGFDEVESGKKYYYIIYIEKAKIISCNANVSGPENIIMPMTLKTLIPYESFFASWPQYPVRIFTTTKTASY